MTQEEAPQDPPETPQSEPAEPETALLQPGDLVKLGAEQPVRMAAITGGRLGSDGPAAPKRRSAIAAYDAPVTFDWRNQPLGGKPPQR